MPNAVPPSVLIIDAEPHHTRVFEAKLSRQNAYSVTTATSAREALTIAFQRSFEVILWDMRLRETFAVLPRLRSLCPLATLILMTTDDRPVIPDEIARLSVSDILVKPIGLDTLIQRLEAARQATPTRTGVNRIELGFVGQPVRLSVGEERFLTRIWEVTPDSFTVIAPQRLQVTSTALPMSLPQFTTGSRLLAEILSEDALYRFVSRLTEELSEPVSLWRVAMPTLIRRQQRRKVERKSLRIPVKLLYDDHSVSGITRDVSTEGCLVVSESPLAIGSEVSLQSGDGVQGIAGAGRVVRLESLSSPASTAETEEERYGIAVQFTEVDTETLQFL